MPLSREVRLIITYNVWIIAAVLMLLAYTVVTYTYFPSLSLIERENFDKIARVEIAGNSYNIPWAFFSLPPGPDVERESFLLAVEWPAAAPIYYGSDRLKRDIPDGSLGWILGKSQEAEIPLQEQLGMILRDYETVTSTEAYGLKMQLMKRRGSDEKREIYFDTGKKPVVSFISCYVPADSYTVSVSPFCEHKFYADKILYNISYQKSAFLPQWQALQERSIALMNSFTRAKIKNEISDLVLKKDVVTIHNFSDLKIDSSGLNKDILDFIQANRNKTDIEDSTLIDLQKIFPNKIRKICDQYFPGLDQTAYENAIGEKLPYYDKDLARSATGFWVFFDSHPPTLISINSVSDISFIKKRSGDKVVCSQDPALQLFHAYISSDSIGHLFLYDLKGPQ